MKSNKYVILSIIMATLLLIGGCSKTEKNANSTNTVKNEKVKVAVSIVPQESFVKAVGKDLVEVTTMIPPGHSPANYEPSPKEMIGLSNASMYFAIGVPTEKANILTKLEDLNK
jgi:zinc transport system substrate-binding protein